jgi:hypothetical protein
MRYRDNVPCNPNTVKVLGKPYALRPLVAPGAAQCGGEAQGNCVLHDAVQAQASREGRPTMGKALLERFAIAYTAYDRYSTGYEILLSRPS